MKITCETAKGARLEQEDRFIIHHTKDGVLFAIMDGHGGEEVAAVCHDFVGSFWDLHAAEKRGWQNTLELVVWQLDSITMEYQSGCTLSLVFIPTDEEQVYVATLGDSPVVVRDLDGVCQVSISHNVRTNQSEAEAAVARGGILSGGYIWNDTGDFGLGLQMARSLGDTYMGPILSRAPDIATHTFGDFVLLATDGVFDPAHTNEKQALADVVALIDSGGDAEAIVDRAVKLPTGDNATAILITKEKKNEVA